MKKHAKKTLKWLGITLLVLLVLIILIPIIFKDQIKEMVIDEVNTSLNAELSLKDFDLTFISTFPNVTIELHDAKLMGKKEFKGVELMNIKKITAHVGLWSVIGGDQIEVDEIHIQDPIIDIRVLADGKANYDIVKPDSEKTAEEIEEPSNFKLSLTKYTVKNAQIKYDDRYYDMSADLKNLNHSGSGDLTADIINFETKTSIDEFTYTMEGVDYLTEVKTDAAVDILMNFSENSSKFTMKENKIKLNNVDFKLNGFYEMFEKYDDMDLSIDASESSFKDFLSLIPAFYHSGYENMVSSGKLSFIGKVKGKMDDINMPGWDFGMKVKGGSIKYPGLSKITNIQVDAGSEFPGGADLDKMTVDVNKFHANLSKNTIDASLHMKKMMSDPYISSVINSHVDLATIKDFMPLEDGEEYQGILDADIEVQGRMSALDQEDYENFEAKGVLELSEMNYHSEGLSEDMKIDHMKFTFSPSELALNELNAKMGDSDFKMDGEISNYFGYMLRNDELKGDFNFNSDYMDLDQLMGIYPEETASTDASTAETTPAEAEPTLVPENVDFKLRTKINKARYNGMDIKNISGDMHIKNEAAALDKFSMDAMGGTIGLTGKYDSKDHDNPKFDFGYSLKKIDIEELTKNFVTVGKLAPIAKFAKGKISSNFEMSSDLTSDLSPVLNSISSDGDLSSNKLAITGFNLLKKIEAVTKFKNLSDQTFKNFKTHFSVHDGKVILTPFNLKMGGIDSKVSGFTTLEKDMSYKIAMNVPKNKIPAEILREVQKGLTLANGLHPAIKLGELPNFIPVNVFATGDPKNPSVTTDLKEQLSAVIKSSVGGVIDEIKTVVKDSVTAIIDNKVDDLKAEVEAQKKKILAEAQEKANDVKAAANTAAAKIRTESASHAAQLIKNAGGNPIKKKLAQVAAKKYTEKAEVEAKRVETEGETQADNIMKKARENADKLG